MVVDYPVGATVWQELRVSSPEGIEKFYAAILGWTLLLNGSKGIFKNQNGDVVAGISIEPGLPAEHSGWVCFLGVENLDAFLERATTLGCVVVDAVYSLAIPGMAVILNDPFGAPFGAALLPEGVAVIPSGELGRLSLVDATNHDIQTELAFQKQLFDSETVEPMDDPIHIFRNDAGLALRGCNEVPPELQEFLPPHWLPWFNVADQSAAVAVAVEAGGRVNAQDNELSFGLWGVVVDPQGSTLKTLQLNRAEL